MDSTLILLPLEMAEDFKMNSVNRVDKALKSINTRKINARPDIDEEPMASNDPFCIAPSDKCKRKMKILF